MEGPGHRSAKPSFIRRTSMSACWIFDETILEARERGEKAAGGCWCDHLIRREIETKELKRRVWKEREKGREIFPHQSWKAGKKGLMLTKQSHEKASHKIERQEQSSSTKIVEPFHTIFPVPKDNQPFFPSYAVQVFLNSHGLNQRTWVNKKHAVGRRLKKWSKCELKTAKKGGKFKFYILPVSFSLI